MPKLKTNKSLNTSKIFQSYTHEHENGAILKHFNITGGYYSYPSIIQT